MSSNYTEVYTTEYITMSVRLDKYLSGLGVCSRRDVAKYLLNHQVMINSQKVKVPGVRLTIPNDKLTIDGKSLKQQELVYYLLNKPKGIVSTTDDNLKRKTVTSLIPEKRRIYPVGRLDKETTGLLLLTNDGELTNFLTHPRYHIDKTYRLTIQGKATDRQLTKLRNGVTLSDGNTAPSQVTILKSTQSLSVLEMTIREGRNRQIRRMCEAVNLVLLELERIRFGHLTLDGTPLGSYRLLTDNEVKQLKSSVSEKIPHD